MGYTTHVLHQNSEAKRYTTGFSPQPEQSTREAFVLSASASGPDCTIAGHHGNTACAAARVGTNRVLQKPLLLAYQCRGAEANA